MILLDHIIEILRLPDLDRRLVHLIVVVNSCRVAPTLINRDLLRKPVRSNSLSAYPNNSLLVDYKV